MMILHALPVALKPPRPYSQASVQHPLVGSLRVKRFMLMPSFAFSRSFSWI